MKQDYMSELRMWNTLSLLPNYGMFRTYTVETRRSGSLHDLLEARVEAEEQRERAVCVHI